MTVIITSFLAFVTIPTGSSLHTIVGLSTACFMATYMVSLTCLIRKRLSQEKLPDARWSLGRSGLWINCVALAYSTWGFFWSFWPTQYVVNPRNFNYAGPLFLMVVVAALSLYLFCSYKESQRLKTL
jgi:amino acid transporter